MGSIDFPPESVRLHPVKSKSRGEIARDPKELEKHKGRDKTASFAKLRDRLEITTSVALEPERVELFVDEEEWARTHSNTKAIDDLCKP